MGELASAEGELGLEVLLEQRSSGDGGLDGSVDGTLGGLAGVRDDSLVGGGGELSLTGGSSVGLAGEEVVIDGRDIDGTHIDGGGGGDDVGLVQAAQRHTIDGVGAGDEEEAALQLLEEDDALAAEAARKDDEDGSGRDGGAELGGAGAEVAVVRLVGVLGRVEAGDLLLGGGGLDLLVATLTEVLEAALQLDHLGPAEPVDAAGDLGLLGHGEGEWEVKEEKSCLTI